MFASISVGIDTVLGMQLDSNIDSSLQKESDRGLYNAFNLTQPLNGSLDCSTSEFLSNLV